MRRIKPDGEIASGCDGSLFDYTCESTGTDHTDSTDVRTAGRAARTGKISKRRFLFSVVNNTTNPVSRDEIRVIRAFDAHV